MCLNYNPHDTLAEKVNTNLLEERAESSFKHSWPRSGNSLHRPASGTNSRGKCKDSTTLETAGGARAKPPHRSGQRRANAHRRHGNREIEQFFDRFRVLTHNPPTRKHCRFGKRYLPEHAGTLERVSSRRPTCRQDKSGFWVWTIFESSPQGETTTRPSGNSGRMETTSSPSPLEW